MPQSAFSCPAVLDRQATAEVEHAPYDRAASAGAGPEDDAPRGGTAADILVGRIVEAIFPGSALYAWPGAEMARKTRRPAGRFQPREDTQLDE